MYSLVSLELEILTTSPVAKASFLLLPYLSFKLTTDKPLYIVLKDKCVDVLYPDVSVNNKCEAFVIGYEKAINSYVSDIKKYNENIKDYNDVLEETDTKIEEVKLTVDYIDVDGDRKYLGKN